MIDDKILDEVLPIPDIETLKEATIQELIGEGFVVTKFRSGGVFYTLLMITLQMKIQFTELLRRILSNMFVSHASGSWLDLKAADYSKARKHPQKAKGNITITRDSAFTDAIKVSKGHVFKTLKDINGEELRFFVLEETTLPKGVASVEILVEAEKEGATYNVPQSQIAKSLIYIDGIGSITNGPSWLLQEGSDTEDDESFGARSLRSWAELASRPIADAYKNAAESVSGVLFARVNDQLPRGQGTLDVIVTSTAGNASDALLTSVRAEMNKIVGPCDNILVKSSVTVAQDINLTISITGSASSEDAINRTKAVLRDLLSVRKDRILNELTHAELIHAIMQVVPQIKNVKITTPAQDVSLSNDKVIILGTVTVTAQGGSAL